MKIISLSFTFLIGVTALISQSLANDSLLPPLATWSGNSMALIHDSSDPWQTPAEATNLTDTPSYQETLEYLSKLVSSDQRLHMLSLGKSPQQRDIWLVIASQNGAKTAQQLHNNDKPTLFFQAGIHSGEIDGKDAGLMLLRDITKGSKGYLLEKVNLVFLPIFNVDGHERRSEFNRVNQRGPKSMGWRTNAQNLNLNRDYAKTDSPEMQLLVSAINEWLPDLYLDIHVTDGEDYQYDITYGFNGEHGDSPAISRWLESNFRPQIDKALASKGHLGGPLVIGMDKMDFGKGIFGWTAGIRFSNGWGDTRHLPTILIENHSLKPYHQRVLGTYIFLEKTIELLAEQGRQLKRAINTDSASRPEKLTLAWSPDTKNPELIDFKGIEYRTAIDKLTGLTYIEWLGKGKTYHDFPRYWARVKKTEVRVPEAYYIPPQYQAVIDRLRVQGLKSEVLTKETKIKATQLSATNPEFGTGPFEGHITVKADWQGAEIETVLAKGSIKISTDQKLGRLAVALLDPRAPDSYFSWGFFSQMFQKTEYIESYAMVPLAKEMLADNPGLLSEFNQTFSAFGAATGGADNKIAKVETLDEMFAIQPDEKMQWLYQRSPYYDQAYLKYPVLLVH